MNRTDCLQNENISENSAPTPKTEVKLSAIGDKPVILNFEGSSQTADAGILLMREIEDQTGLIRAMAGVIPDPRDARYVRHTLTDLLIQRVGQICCGYEDADDCNILRDDPVFKILAGRYPEIGEALASQPTMSRFENRVSRKMLYRLAYIFADTFVASYDSPPTVIVIDFDDTENRVHGDQQLSLFNSYYGNYCYMPLHVYEGLSGKLITTILKPGKRSDGKQMLSIVKRVVGYLHDRWPDTLIIFRGDSHFAYPEVMNYIEHTDMTMYVTGMSTNSVLKREVKAHIDRAKSEYEKRNEKVTLFHSFYYKAGSWDCHRRVVAKIEMSEMGENIRFIVSDMKDAKATVLYKEIYCARGEDELYIKDHKLYLKSDRTSCHRFESNQFRLFLHSAVYVFMHTLKTEILRDTVLSNATFETIRKEVLKVTAQVRELKTRIKIELSPAFPMKDLLIRGFGMSEMLRAPG